MSLKIGTCIYSETHNEWLMKTEKGWFQVTKPLNVAKHFPFEEIGKDLEGENEPITAK